MVKPTTDGAIRMPQVDGAMTKVSPRFSVDDKGTKALSVTKSSKAEAKEESSPAMAERPEYPYGLCLRLGKEEMAKLQHQSTLAIAKFEDMKAAGDDTWEKMVTEMEKVRDAFIHSFSYFKSQVK